MSVVRQLWHPTGRKYADGTPFVYPELWATCDTCGARGKWDVMLPPVVDPQLWWKQESPRWDWQADADGSAVFTCGRCIDATP